VGAHVSDRLSAFLDSALDSAERLQVSGHLETCLECQKALNELRVLDELARERPHEMEPGDHPLDLVAGLRTQLKRPRRPSRVPWWLAAAATGAFVAFIPWMLVRRNPAATYPPHASPPVGVAPPTRAANADELARAGKDTLEPDHIAQRGAGHADTAADRREKRVRAAGALAPAERPAPQAERQGFAPAPPPPPALAPASVPAQVADAAAEEDFARQRAPGTGGRVAPRDGKAAEAPAPVAKPAAQSETAAGLVSAGATSRYSSSNASGPRLDAGAATSAKQERPPRQSFSTAEDARQARERWAEAAARATSEKDAESARVASIEAAAAAYELSEEEEDLVRLGSLAHAYLDGAGPRSVYVRQLLDRALAKKTP
jgi:hypothetical protein